MTTFDHEIEIGAPIEYAFEWGTTPENWQRATPALTAVRVVEETDEGIHYRNTIRMLGRSVTSDELYVVDEDSHHTISYFDDEEMSGEMHFQFTEIDGGTHVRLYGEIADGTSLSERLLQPLFAWYMNRQFRNTLRSMKELIEAEAPGQEHSEAVRA